MRTQLIGAYGPTASGKTTQILELVDYARKTNKDAYFRLVSASGGGWAVIQPAVDAGLVKPLWIKNREHPFYVINRVTKGAWPEDSSDPKSKLISLRNQTDAKWDLNNLAGIAFESGSEMCTWMMQEALEGEASGDRRIAQEKATIPWSDGPKGDEDRFANPAMSHYGAIQSRIKQFIGNSQSLPFRFVYWTFFETKGKYEKAPVYGPDTAGQAIVGETCGMFDRTIRLAIYPKKSGVPERRMYLMTHYEGNDPYPYLCNARMPLAYWKSGGKVSLDGENFSLKTLLEIIDKHNEEE